jgi:succinate dehydrogenase/fumarate reductase flavoprotein subunit
MLPDEKEQRTTPLLDAEEKKVTRPQFIKEAAGVAGGMAIEWNKEADVVVVGSGFAGMAAAVEAADGGASVIVLEMGDHAGGHSILSGGNCQFAGTHVQRAQGIEDKSDWLYEDQMLAGETCLWLEKLGVKWGRMQLQAGCRVPRSHRPGPSPDYAGGLPDSGGISIWMVLARAAEDRKVPILLKHKMTRLLRPDPKGPVIGVEVESEGKTLNIKANKTVILGTGGFMANTQMCMAWDPRLGPDLGASGLPYADTPGIGHNAAVDVGAGLTDMSFVCYLPIKWGSKVNQWWEPPTLKVVPKAGTGVSIEDFRRVILVKTDGKRYINESLVLEKTAAPAYPQAKWGNKDYTANIFTETFLNLKERPRNVWAVTDAEGARALKWPVDQMAKPDPKVFPALYPDFVAVAQTLQELATKMGVDPANFEATVAHYNGFVTAGKDEDFAKPGPLSALSRPPFYGAKLAMLRHSQACGLRANTKGQVLERSDQYAGKGVSIDQEKVIPHLYAAGECVGGYFGNYHMHGKIGHYMTWGRVAGKNAAAEKSWV